MQDAPRAMAIGSLVVGLISIAVGFCCGLCGSPFPIIGLILGIVALTQSHDRGLAIAGIVVNGLAIVVIVAMLAVNAYLFTGQPGAGGVQPFQDLIPGLDQLGPPDHDVPPPHDPSTVPSGEPSHPAGTETDDTPEATQAPFPPGTPSEPSTTQVGSDQP